MASTSRLGVLVKNRRKRHGITIEELARKSGLSQGYISKIERGGAVGAIYRLFILANTLGLRPSALILRAYEDVTGVRMTRTYTGNYYDYND